MAYLFNQNSDAQIKYERAVTAQVDIEYRIRNTQIEIAIATLLSSAIVSLFSVSNSNVARVAILVALLAALSAIASGSLLVYNLQSPYALWLVSREADARLDTAFRKDLKADHLVVHGLLLYAILGSVLSIGAITFDSNHFVSVDRFTFSKAARVVLLVHLVIFMLLPLLLWQQVYSLLRSVKLKVDANPDQYLYRDETGQPTSAEYVQFTSRPSGVHAIRAEPQHSSRILQRVPSRTRSVGSVQNPYPHFGVSVPQSQSESTPDQVDLDRRVRGDLEELRKYAARAKREEEEAQAILDEEEANKIALRLLRDQQGSL